MGSLAKRHGPPAALAGIGLLAGLAHVHPAAMAAGLAPAHPPAHARTAPRQDRVRPVPGARWDRVDEGQDLQGPGTRPLPVYALAAGTVVRLGPDPGGFGWAYPGLVLDRPVRTGGRAFTEIYYGHTFLSVRPGTHVPKGAVIARTGGPSSGGDAANLPNWAEVGFCCPISYANGPLMHSWLAQEIRGG